MPTTFPDLLPYGRQSLDDDDIAAVVSVLRGKFLTTGPAVTAFETALAERVGSQHAVVCSSGTAGLHLAAMALGLGGEDAVVVPTTTFVATANAARYVGAEVVFSDVDPDTGLMGPSELEHALARVSGRRVRAVFPVHLNGQCADTEGIAEVGRRSGLFVVEDATHAIGSTHMAGKKLTAVGSCQNSAMAVFSFHPVKTVAMGEGGAVTVNDDSLAERLKRLRNHGLIHDRSAFANNDLAIDETGAVNPWYYEVAETGFNYRASDINCALGLSQLRKLDRFIEKRRQLVSRYDERLAPFFPVVRPVARRPGNQPAWHLYVALIDFAQCGIDRGATMRRLAERKIGTQVHYIPLPLQPLLRAEDGLTSFPGTAKYYDRCLSLPLFPAMGDSDVDHVVDALTEVLGMDKPT